MISRRMMILGVLLLLLAGGTQAQPGSVTVLFDAGVTNQTTALTGYGTYGGMMVGMVVTAYFSDETFEQVLWTASSYYSGAANGTGWSLEQSGDTWDRNWRLYNGTGKAIVRIEIDAGPGNTVFDTYWPGNTEGTPGSARGKDFTVTGGLGNLTIIATYRDVVTLTGSAPVGDLYRRLDIDFVNAGGFGSGRTLYYVGDTDNILFAGDIEPVNTPPTCTPIGDPPTIAAEGKLYSAQFSCTDPDQDDFLNVTATVKNASNEPVSIGTITPSEGSSPLTVTFNWTPAAADAAGAPYTVTITVKDLADESAYCQFNINYVNRSPVISCNAPWILWPPSHDLFNVSSAFNVVDPDRDALLLTIRTLSNEPESGETGGGAGKHAPDFKNELNGGRGLLVRSEREGGGEGRFYLFVITADDMISARRTHVCVAAVVPHDQTQQSLATIKALAVAKAAAVRDKIEEVGVDNLDPSALGLYEHGKSAPLGPKQ
jgi:hypothetical protein